MFIHKSFRLNFLILMYDVIEIIDLHKDVNINTLFDSINKKTLQMILHVLKMKEKLQ